MEGDRIDWERLDRFILGEGSPEERAAVQDMMNADATFRSLVDAMRTVGVDASLESPRWDAPRALEQVRRQLGIEHRDITPITVPLRSRVRRTLMRVCVITGAAAAVMLGVFWRSLSDRQLVHVPAQAWATAWTP